MSENTKKRTWVTKVIIAFVAFLMLLTFFSNTIMNFFIPKVAGKRIGGGTLSFTDKTTAEVEPATSYKIKGVAGRKRRSFPVVAYWRVSNE